MKIGIIGAGASGMMAAITAAETPENRVLLFERQARVGKKLLATGNGRCNLTNLDCTDLHYHGSSAFAAPALAAFTAKDTLDFFQAHGLLTVAEPSGRVYPFTDQANSVVDVLRFALARTNIELHTSAEILSVKYDGGQFMLKTAEESFCVDKLIVTAGGLAGTKLGGSLSGNNLLRSLGHHSTKLYPSLVQLKTDDTLVKGLKGVRAQATVQIRQRDAVIAQSGGEVQFTEYGLSGPAIFDVSRAVSVAGDGCTAVLDLLPAFEGDKLLSALCIRIAKQPDLTCDDLLTGFLHNRLGRVLLKYVGISGQTAISDLPWAQLSALCEAVHQFCLDVRGTMGMDCAQVTAGGICTEEFDANTLQSKLVPGLYAAGEVLDVDGDCGGYNLQWAWASGRLAGKLSGDEKC